MALGLSKMMDRELREKWITALRSGQYKQARNVLVDGNRFSGSISYCCLGVLLLCDGWNDPARAHGVIDGQELGTSYLRRIGMYSDHHRDLINMNDGRGTHPHSFAEIADYVESQL